MQSPFQQERPVVTVSSGNHSKSSRGLGYVKGTLLYDIPGNKSEASPGTCVFFDTEAIYDPRNSYVACEYQRLRLGVAISGRLETGRFTRQQECRFTEQGVFWRHIMERSDVRRPVWLFAHNIGYDLALVGFPELLRDGVFKIFDPKTTRDKTDRLSQKYKHTTGFICTDDPPVIISATHQDGWKLICVDTFNYWTKSLAAMGEVIGSEKLPMPPIEASNDDWFNYCRQDVVVVQKSVLAYIEWIKENNLGKFRFTVPSQAFAAYRHRWNKPPVKTHNNITLRKFERESYYGGRLECFYIGEVRGKMYELDVTSLYPYVMRDNLYPCELQDFCLPTTHTKQVSCELGLDTIARVLLHTKTGYPVRQQCLGTIYPVGDYWTTLAGPELVSAKESGYIRSVNGWARYKLRDLFTGFVDFFWNYRLEQKQLGNTMNADLAKLLMNGFYGKWGQMTSAWTDRPDIPNTGKIGLWGDETFADGSFPWFRNVGHCVQQFTGKQEHPFAFPAIAAYVTSYARELMRMYRKVAGERNVYYLVTDALFVNQAGFDNLQHSNLIATNELGSLRVKHSADIAEFEALHHYKIGDHSVNGSRKKSARLNQDGSITEMQFESFERILMRQPDGSVHVKPLTKVFSKEYKRGTRQDDGWIKPLLLTES